MKNCVIIGSGLGGLSTGVALAKNGYRVTILEQAAQIGGCLQCFYRDGVKFETGMHFVGSLDDHQVLSNYLNYLGIKDKISFSRLDSNGYDVVSLQGERFAFPNGRDAFLDVFTQRFPSQKENLQRYCELVEQVASMSPFRDLTHTERPLPAHSELLQKTINEIIDDTICDPLLREVLASNLSLYAAQRDKTPFATHAFIFDFYNTSAFRIVGGSDTIVKALYETLLQHGGRVLTQHKVTRILVEDKKATGIVTDDGQTFAADVVISDINPKQMVDLVNSKVFTEAYRSRVKSIADTTSVFSLFLRFKENTVPYQNYNFHGFQTDSPWKMNGHIDETWPQGYLYMHHCHEANQRYARGGVVLAYMSMDELQRWKDTTIGHRGTDYETFKRKMAERLLDAVEKDFPDIRNHIAAYYTATPLSYRDYTLTPKGSVYGLAKNVNNIADRVSFKTKVPNLLLVGQNINAHGMLGVLVGTMTVCQHLLGEETVKSQMIEANRKSTVIIGGGLGGLVTGALLAKEGYKVTVLEKNAIVGGGLQTFKRYGVSFPTGMHIFGGFEKGGNLYKLFDYLGIMERLSLQPTDDDAFDVVYVAEDGNTFRFPKSKTKVVEYLSTLFPEEKEDIQAYFDRLFELSEEEDLFYLRESHPYSMANVSDDFTRPYNELIDRYITHPKLKGLLTYLSPLFGGVEGMTPAYLNALLSVLHIAGTFQFAGGSQQMVNALCNVIEETGGRVIANEEVTRIQVENHQVTAVVSKQGNIYHADSYISDVHPDILLRISDEKAFPIAFKKRIAEIPESESCFKVYVKFKDKTFPYLNHANYYLEKYNSHHNQLPEDWPNGLMFVTPPQEHQGDFATTMVIIAPMDYAWVLPWEKTLTGHRGETYEQWKQAMTDKMLDRMTRLYPDFRDCIEFVFASSPLTIRDYYGNKKGSNYGFQKDSNNLMLSQLSVFTKVKNLYLTGQNVNIHGFCGVSLTAIETAEALVGYNTIVRKINNFCMNQP